MWKRIKETQYFLLFSQDCKKEICITDYISVWTSVFSEKAFLAQLKESNDGLELPHDNDFIQKGVQLLSNLDDLKTFRIEKKENGKSLFITMAKSFGFPFYLECTLSKGSEELYFQKVTRSLVKTICDLRESQSELRRLLIKKDSEIEEYKCEGGEIVLRHLKTKAFNDVEHMKRHKVYEDNFGASSASTSFLQEAVETLEKNVLKQEAKEDPTPGPSTKAEFVSVIKAEPGHIVKMEPDSTAATESIPSVKVEPKTEAAEESNVPVITASVSFKQEIKRETARAHIPRKRTAYNYPMADKPDDPMDLSDLPLPSRLLLIAPAAPKSSAQRQRECRQRIAASRTPKAAPKSSAQRQRECRQRIAASRTPAQSTAMRISDTERKLNNRLHKAANLDIASGSLESTTASSTPKSSAQRQREYRQRIAASRTPAQSTAMTLSDTERKRKYRLRKAANLALANVSLESTTASSSCSAGRSNDVQNCTQRQLTNHQRQSLAAEPAQTSVQPGTSSDQIKVPDESMDLTDLPLPSRKSHSRHTF